MPAIRFREGSCLETQTVAGASLEQLNAVFFISARKPGAGARNGFTPTSPRGPLRPCAERHSETARGIRRKGRFFAGTAEVLLGWTGGAGQLEEWQWGGWQALLGTKCSWQKAPSLPSHRQDGVCQLVTKSLWMSRCLRAPCRDTGQNI